MKEYYRATIALLVVAFVMMGIVSRAGAADESSAALDAFADSYRQEKKAQHKEKILKVLRPSEDRSAQRSQEFVIRSLYDQAELAYRQKDYAASKGKLEDLRSQFSQGSLSESVRLKWSKKADALYKKIAAQELRQQKAAYKKQPVKKEKKEKKVKKKADVAPVAAKPVAQPAVTVPSPDAAKREKILNMLQQRKQELQLKRDTVQKEYSQGLEKMYGHAVELYKVKDYMPAHVVFQDIQQLSPNYKDTASYLKRLERLIVQ